MITFPFRLILSVSLFAILFTLSPALAQVSPDHYFPLPDQLGEVIESQDQAFFLQTVVEGLDNPWSMAFLPDGSMLITERDSGKLRWVVNGTLQERSIDGVPEVFNQNQGGLFDVVLHPDFEQNRMVYLALAMQTGGIPGRRTAATVVGRGELNDYSLDNFEIIFESTPETRQPFHFGGRIVFDREGYLYSTVGDRGTMENAQDLSNHAGTVFRLYDDGSVPQDNPFTDQADAQPEIYTYGNRNIQGMILHPETGEVWSNEHGPRGGDEINIMRAGNNYGWPEITHGVNYDGSVITPDTAAPGMEQPLHHWTPSIAPSGMAIVHNSEHYPNWNGDVFNGALAGQHLNRVVVDLEQERFVHEERLLRGIARIRDVRFAPDGYLYILEESNGRILRLLPAE